MKKVKNFLKNIYSLFFYRIVDQIIYLHTEAQYNKFRKKYNISSLFRFNGKGIIFYGDGEIICKEFSYIGKYSSIQAYKGCKVVIGKKCRISHFVQIYTHSAIADSDFSLEEIPAKIGDVIINDYCWIGAKVFINPGVEIGENCVVGAHSVVTKSLPPHSICVGVPARVIKFKKYLSEKEKKELAYKYKDVLSERLKKELL